MKFFIISVFTALVVSCSGGTAPPTKDEVEEMVGQWYHQQSSKDGGGSWNIGTISVISIEKDKSRKKIFHTVSEVSGIYHNPPLEIPKPDEPFSEQLRMDLEWNGAKWVTTQ